MKKFVVFFIFFSISAFAEPLIYISYDKEIPRGQAVHIKIVTNFNAELYNFSFQDKTASVTPDCSESGCYMELLLPAKYYESGEYLISAKMSGEFEHSFELPVKVLDKEYRTQSLKVDSKYVKLPDDVLERIGKESRQTKELLATYSDRKWTAPFTVPVDSKVITSEFGNARVFNGEPRNRHSGIDFSGATGDNAYAISDGTVIFVGEHYFAGQNIYVDHGLGVISIYMHLSEYAVKEGDEVKAGQIVGKIGATGRVTGAHLHMSLAVLGEMVDADPFFNK